MMMMMMLVMVMLFVTANMARYQDIVKWFYSQPIVCYVAVYSDVCCRSCTSALEQHDSSADEPTAGGSS